jgi:alpha-tubulin suppressor-like RCC1 family protein
MFQGLKSDARRTSVASFLPRRGRHWRRLVGSNAPLAVSVSVVGASLLLVGVATSTAATPAISAISAGQYHTCALTTSGGVKCWGDNTFGQLGDATASNRTSPVDVSGLTSGVTAVASGQYHTCALTTSGGVKCWGDNSLGALGDGTNVNRPTPVDVSGLTSGVVAIAAGYFHTCALTSAGGVKCWGYNVSGALGDGTTTRRSSPVDVTGLSSGVTAISAGQYHTCALTNGGGVKCWGYNVMGALGDGTNVNRLTPVDVSGLTSGATAVSAGGYHTCALTTGGGVKCWGYNATGQLGDGSTTNRSTPVDVSGLTSGVIAVSAGFPHSCALTSAGGVKCWGYNGMGGVGDGTTTTRATPVDVSGLTSGAIAVSAGGYHTCALTTGGGVKCWGYNASGQLGDGTTTTRLAPEIIFSPSAVASPTTLTVKTSGGDFADASSVSATLTDANTSAALSGKQVTFTLNASETCTAVTDAGGVATCSMTPGEAAGTYALKASFAGDTDFSATSGSADFVVSLEETTIVYTGPKMIPSGNHATLSGVLLEDNTTPISGRTLTMTLGDGAGSQSCTGTTDSTGAASCVVAPVNQPLGAGTAMASFAGDDFYQPAGHTESTLAYAFSSTGAFVVGDKSASGSVTFWSPQWSKDNTLSAGPAPATFKGFENGLVTPVCGASWTTTPGDSASAPTVRPSYMPVVVSGTITRSGSTVSGDVLHVVIVKTDPATAGNDATGTVVAQLC